MVSNGCIKNKQKEMIMNTIRLFVTRHPLVTFFGLAYAFAWWPWLLHVTVPNFPYIQLTPGPFLAAVTVSALIGGWAEVKAYLRGLLHWRAGVHWYALALALPVVLALVAVYLNVLFGAPPPSPAQLAGITVFFSGFAYMLLFPLSPGVEELGWRGYAQPRLQVERSALTASVIVGIMHGLWHLPLFFVPGSAQSNVPFAAFLLTVIALNVLMAWLYNSAQGSVVIAMIFHAAFDAIGLGFLDFLFSGIDKVRLWWLLAAVLSLAAGLVVLVMGPNLGLTRSTQAEHAAVIR